MLGLIHDPSRNARQFQMAMIARPADLPDFDNPPVIEVVLGVQFDQIHGFQTIHASELWGEFREEFPLVQEVPPLTPTYETFGTNPLGVNVRFEVNTGPAPFPRLWFLSSEHAQLIQFQPDRFVHNWRKARHGDVYPRYENIRYSFQSELRKIERFFKSHQLGELIPNQCEISYINHITSDDINEIHSRPEEIFRFFDNDRTAHDFDALENASFQLRYVLYTDENRPIGRLHVTSQPAFSNDGKRILVVTLSARGNPTVPSLDAVLAFLDHGREKIVRSFAELTTDRMHERWGRTQ